MNAKIFVLFSCIVFPLSSLLSSSASSGSWYSSSSSSSASSCDSFSYSSDSSSLYDDFSATSTVRPVTCGSTTIIPRSVNSNSARRLVGWQQQLYRNYCCGYAATALAVEYTRTFKSDLISRSFFGANTLTFSGSLVSSREDGIDVIGDNFGLAPNEQRVLSLKPVIQNTILDWQWYWGLNQLMSGLYARIHAPLTHTNWDLGLNECSSCTLIISGTNDYSGCYMDSTETPVNTTTSLAQALGGDFLFGDMQEPWQYGRFEFGGKSKTGIADMDFIIGYNIYQGEQAHIGIFGQLVAPTGNRPNAHIVFEPVLGNGKMWGLGGGASVHFPLYRWCNRENNLMIYAEGSIIHPFATHQIRSLDFARNGFLSRYLLLKEFDTAGVYAGHLMNAINFTTRPVQVSVDYIIDASAMITFNYSGWETDLGYNFYKKSHENLSLSSSCSCPYDNRTFGIKGTEGVCYTQYIVSNDGTTIALGSSPLLNSTQSNATIFSPTVTGTIDNAVTTDARDGSGDGTVGVTYDNSIVIPIGDDVTFPTDAHIAFTSNPPVFVNCTDLDTNSAAQCGVTSHKIFCHIGRHWNENCWQPHMGVGAEVELLGRCSSKNVYEFGVWIKGGLAF